MLGQKRIKEITDTILAASPADQTEVVVISGDSYLTRFANSTIHQNVAETDAEVRVRVVVREGAEEGARVGVATTHNLDPDSLTRTVQDAAEAARLQPVNPHFTSLPGPQPISQADGFSESTANCSPEQRARAAGAVCLMAREAGVVASGALTTAEMELAVVNSLGTFAYHPATYAELNTVIMSGTSAGYAAGVAMNFDDLDYEAIGREAVEKCLRSQNPQALAPGEYVVILEPYAVQDFVQMMGYTGFSALAYQEGRSFMSGKLGEQMVDRRINIWDDGLSTEGIPLPFDFEGVPKQRVELIKDGAANAVVYDSYRAAREEGKRSTGHALPAPNRFGPFPLNTFFATGDTTLEEMIAGTERGIYVTRFHYTRPVEPKRVVITGMTRDGTFLIENGEIAYPVKNLRFTQSYLEALNNLDSIGSQAKMLEGMGGIGHDSVPALKLNEFNFTGATEF